MSSQSTNTGSGENLWIKLGAALVVVMIVALDIKAMSAIFGPRNMSAVQFVETLARWHSKTLWQTKIAIPHPLVWHWAGALIPIVLVAGAYTLFFIGHRATRSSSGLGRFFGGTDGSTKTSDDPAKWLPYAPRKYASFTPDAVIRRDVVRPSMTDVAKKDRRLDDYGFVVGYVGNKPSQPIAITSELSVLVTGEPRSGKTAGFVIPWISSWQGPVVTTSTRNEVLRATLLARKRVSEHIYALTLPGVKIPERVQAISYDICWFYKDEMDALVEAAERRASIFSGVASDKSQPIWENATRQIFACLLLIAFAWRHAQVLFLGNDAGSARPNLAGLKPETSHVDVLKHFATLEWTRTKEAVVDVQRFLAEHIPEGKGAYAAAYVGSVVRTFQNATGDTEFARTIMGMISVGLGKLNDPQIAAVFSTPWDKPVFDPSEFLAESGTLYLISRSEDSEDLAKFFSLVVNEIAAAAGRRAAVLGRCDPGLALILDELANIAPLPNLKGYMSEGGGRGITTVAIVQNLRQLVSTYGQDKMLEIVSSANVLCIFGGAKAPEDLDIAVNLAGSRIAQMASYDKAGALTGRSEASQAALDPNQIANMPEGWIFLKLPSSPPIIVKTVYYWRYPKAWQLGWKKEWGDSYDPDVQSYSFHGTSRSLSLNAVRELAMESDKIPLTPFQVEIPLFVEPDDDEGGTDSTPNVSLGKPSSGGPGGAGGAGLEPDVHPKPDSAAAAGATRPPRITSETIAQRRAKLAREREALSPASSLKNYDLDKMDIQLLFPSKPESIEGPEDSA